MEPATAPPLLIGATLRQGFEVFARAPGAFIAFTLIGAVSQLISQALENRATAELASQSEPIVAFVALALLGLLWSVVSTLWFNVGLIRGAWLALSGHPPRLADLVRVDGAAMRRLLAVWLLLLLVFVLILSSTALIAGLVSLVSARLALLPLIAGAAIFVAVWSGQLIQLPTTVIGQQGALATFRCGQGLLAAQGWRLLVLALAMAGILALGLLALGVGLLVAVPVVGCCQAVAYRQLRDLESAVAARPQR